MLTLLDIRFNFLCRSTHQNEQGKNPIVLRINFNKDRRDIFTGLHCSKINWDAEENKVSKKDKSFQSINETLEIILRKANNAFDALRFSREIFSIDELVDKIKGKDQKPELLIDFLEAEIGKVKKRIGVDLTLSSFYRYRRTLQYVKDFLQTEFKARNYTINRIDSKFMELYFQYLRIVKKLAHNSALKLLQMFKSNLKPLIKTGIIKSDPFEGLKLRPKPVYPDFLTKEELDKIINTDLQDPILDRKRDIFLFACFTGLAYVDLAKLVGKDISQDLDGSWHIRKTRQKTGEQFIIPLLPVSERILRKYSPTEDPRDFYWGITSNQKMNKGLKSVGIRCGISKPLHMHLARHTFATTVTLSNGVPIESVSKMLGHSNIRITQHYAKVVALKVKCDMARIADLYR